MEWSSSNISASSVAQYPSGSVGEILISVSHVTRSNAVETMFQGKRKKNCLNVQVKRNAHSRLSTQLTEKNMPSDAVCARIWSRTQKDFE